MIVKSKDDNQDQIDYLTDLLERDFSDDKKRLIDRELRNLYSGAKGEATSAYYLEFEFRKSKNWVLIHDLRIEHEGDVAQIDHLLIGRMLDFYVIESKNFNYGVTISDEGDFSYFYKNRPYAIASPIAQNERHISVLNRYLMDKELLPKRLGMTIKPVYKNIVLISPTSRLTKPTTGTYDCSGVMKADKFKERFNEDLYDDSVSSMANLAKVISQQNLQLFTEKLALAHTPITINYRAKFGIDDESEPVKEQVSVIAEPAVGYESVLCPKCGKAMVKRVAKKGKNAGAAFWGCVDYPACRGNVATTTTAADETASTHEAAEVLAEPEKQTGVSASAPACPKCSGTMVKRVTKKGEQAGKEFWGCEQFPKCFGTLPVE